MLDSLHAGSHRPFSTLRTNHISRCVPTHEWQTATSCNGTKLIAPIDWGDFQISLIYQFCALAFHTFKISSLVDGQVKSQIAFDYLDGARESSGNPATYYLDVTSGSRLAKRMTKDLKSQRKV